MLYIKYTIVCSPESIKVGPKTVRPLWTELLTHYQPTFNHQTPNQLLNCYSTKHAYIKHDTIPSVYIHWHSIKLTHSCIFIV